MIKRPRRNRKFLTFMYSGVVPRTRALAMRPVPRDAGFRSNAIGTASETVGRVALSRSKSRYFSPYSNTRVSASVAAEAWPSSPPPDWPGLMLRMMTLFAPSFRICSNASRLEPSPIASIEMTEPTPNTTPSTVSKLRSLCSRRFLIPTLTIVQFIVLRKSWNTWAYEADSSGTLDRGVMRPLLPG